MLAGDTSREGQLAATIALLAAAACLWASQREAKRTGRSNVKIAESTSKGETGEEEPDEEPDEEPRTAQSSLVTGLRLVRSNSRRLSRNLRKTFCQQFTPRALDPMEPWTLDDVEFEPAIDFAIKEIKQYVADWNAADKDKFWQRKSEKVVLAVVVCEHIDGSLVGLRGMNTEVSLPSGSLCAERAGIARAASEFFCASSIKAIAVKDPSNSISPIWPCEVCQSWLAKLRDENPSINIIAFPAAECFASCNNFFVRRNGKDVGRPQKGKDVRPPPLRSRRGTF